MKGLPTSTPQGRLSMHRSRSKAAAVLTLLLVLHLPTTGLARRKRKRKRSSLGDLTDSSRDFRTEVGSRDPCCTRAPRSTDALTPGGVALQAIALVDKGQLADAVALFRAEVSAPPGRAGASWGAMHCSPAAPFQTLRPVARIAPCAL